MMKTRRRSDSRREKRATISAQRSSPGGLMAGGLMPRPPLVVPAAARADRLQVRVLERRCEHADAVDVLAGRDELAHDPRRVVARASANVRQPALVSTCTPPGRLSSAGVPAAATAPWLMIATRSQTSSTSDNRCEFSSTLTPRSRSRSSSARTV